MRALVRKVATVIKQPALAGEYANWLVQRAMRGGDPVRVMHGRVRLGDFANFSEFHSVGNFLSDDEVRFLDTYPFGEGAIVDVGANVGLVSLVLSNRYPDRVIHAFEPNPSTFLALTANVARNRAKAVHCHELAVADKSGTLLFNADPEARGTAGITEEATRYSRSVDSVALDDFCARNAIRRIGFLKVDVEGYETLVFRGAGRTLAEIRPTAICFEVCPALAERAGFDRAEPAKILLNHGYILLRWDVTGAMVPASLCDLEKAITENWVAFSE